MTEEMGKDEMVATLNESELKAKHTGEHAVSFSFKAEDVRKATYAFVTLGKILGPKTTGFVADLHSAPKITVFGEENLRILVKLGVVFPECAAYRIDPTHDDKPRG